MACSGTLEVQRSASIPGDQIRLRQVVRWSDADAASFAPVADLLIDRIEGSGNRKLSLEEISSTLSSAGVNLAMVRFSGSSVCLVSRNVEAEPVVATADHAVVQQWMQKSVQPASNATLSSGSDNASDASNPFHSLRERVIADLAERLSLPVDQLQLTFEPKDKSLLNLAEPTFRFQLDPHRVRDLGQVSWNVTIASGENQQKVLLIADARCWEHEIVAARAVSYKQVLQNDDVVERRVLVDHIPEDQLLTLAQVVGQQAARDLKPGTVLTARLVDPVPLARNGQYISVTLNLGGVQVKTVAVAMEAGSFGQTIKVKSEQTHDVYEVTLVGPQTATMGPPSRADASGDAKLASLQSTEP